jgi:hypothetical protein
VRVVPALSKPTRFIAPFVLIAGVLSSSAVAGCTSAAVTFCNDVCDCEGNCSTTSRETCIKTSEDNEKLSNDVGCGGQWGAWSSCIVDRSQCIGGKYTTGGCDTESSKLNQCLNSAKCAFLLDGIHCL